MESLHTIYTRQDKTYSKGDKLFLQDLPSGARLPSVPGPLAPGHSFTVSNLCEKTPRSSLDRLPRAASESRIWKQSKCNKNSLFFQNPASDPDCSGLWPGGVALVDWSPACEAQGSSPGSRLQLGFG